MRPEVSAIWFRRMIATRRVWRNWPRNVIGRAELERLRREKREVEIELAILKGAVELASIRAGRRPGQPD